jgi:hypothetical protein
MPNHLTMLKQQHVTALLELGRSFRRIEAETGVRRETVSRYDRARRAKAAKTFPGSAPASPTDAPETTQSAEGNAAKTFPGSPPNAAKTFPGSPHTAATPFPTPDGRPRFAAAAYRTAITEKLDAGLSLQRIWQDLVEEFGYGDPSHDPVYAGGLPPITAQLTDRLRHLRLSGMVEALAGRVAQAEAAPLAHLEFLELLVDDELTRRADRLFGRRVKQAGIGTVKTLAEFGWRFNAE